MWYSDVIGYGFISPDDRGENILVRRTGIYDGGPKPLESSAEVIYEAIRGTEGMEAKNISRI